MKLKKLFFTASFIAGFLLVACNKDDDNDENTNTQDQTFVMQAAMSNRAEVDLGTLASTKATNSSVKAFAQMMVTEHSTAQSDLQNVAKRCKC